MTDLSPCEREQVTTLADLVPLAEEHFRKEWAEDGLSADELDDVLGYYFPQSRDDRPIPA